LDEDDETRLKHHATASAEAAAAAAETTPPKRRFGREWAALLFAVVSFIIAQLIVVTLHYRSTRLTHETEEIKLARDLYREFYLNEKSYLQIAGAIESCRKLYKNEGGSFGHVAINEYLGFFSDLGLFIQRGALSEELIGHFFGAYIVEAYEYPEIKSYIERTRTNFQQPEAFAEFEKVAEAIESDPRFKPLVTLAKTMCANQQPEGAPAAPSSSGEASDSESGNRSQAPIDVHRHRPGACPEGPPCKGDE
jgi:hypothetical protein